MPLHTEPQFEVSLRRTAHGTSVLSLTPQNCTRDLGLKSHSAGLVKCFFLATRNGQWVICGLLQIRKRGKYDEKSERTGRIERERTEKGKKDKGLKLETKRSYFTFLVYVI